MEYLVFNEMLIIMFGKLLNISSGTKHFGMFTVNDNNVDFIVCVEKS